MSLKGDLKNVQLADLFQTLSQNQQQGVLTISAGGGSRRILFAPDGITLLDPQVAGRRRLGEILLSAGLITEEQLTEALREQSRSRKFLGETLIDAGRVTPEDLSRLLQVQVEEELYGLFRIDTGVFEFRDGQDGDSAIPQVNPMHVDGIVLEAARRLDEWRLIQEQIPDLERIYVPTTAQPVEDEDANLVLSYLDGRRSVQEAADALLTSPFTIAKILAELAEQGLVRESNSAELHHSAMECLGEGKKRQARKILHCLQAVDSARDEYLEPLAALFREAEDHPAAAQARLRLARFAWDEENFENARDHLLEALKDRPDSIPVLSRLADVYQELGDKTNQARYLKDLAELHKAGGDPEAAIRCLEKLLPIAEDADEILRHLVDCCLRARLKEKALEILEKQVAELKKSKRHDELPAVYKRILTIDPGRNDVKRALTKVSRTKREKLLRIAAWSFVIGTVLCVAGWYMMREQQRKTGLFEVAEANRILAGGDPQGARVRVQEALAKYPLEEVVMAATSLIDRIDERIQEDVRSARDLREGELDSALSGIQDLQDRREFDQSLSALLKLFEETPEAYLRSRVSIRIRASIESLIDHVIKVIEFSDAFERPIHDSEVTPAYVAAVKFFPASTAEQIQQVQAALDSNETDFGQELAEKLDKANRLLNSWTEANDRMQPEIALLRERHERLNVLEQLSDEFMEAQRMVAQGHLSEAHALFETVLKNYGDGELRDTILKRLSDVEAVMALIARVDQQIAENLVEQAHSEILIGIEEYPDLPVDSLVPLPIRITSMPTGARVEEQGRYLGETPRVVRIARDAKRSFRLSMPGFATEEFELDSKRPTRSFQMRMNSLFQVQLDVPVDAAPIHHGTEFFVASRDGILLAINPEAEQPVRKLETRSLSGSRTSPVGTPFGIAFTVVEGTVSMVDPYSEELTTRWSVDLQEEIHHEPTIHDRTILVVTQLGNLVGLDGETGRELFRLDLQRKPVARPVVHERHAYICLEGGELMSVDLERQETAFRKVLEEEIHGAPAVRSREILCTTITGQVVCLDAASGVVRWILPTNDLPRGELSLSEGFAFLPLGRRIEKIDLQEKRSVHQWTNLPIAGDSVCMGELTLVGGKDGILYGLRGESSLPYFITHVSEESVVGQPVLTPNGVGVLCEDGVFQIFER